MENTTLGTVVKAGNSFTTEILKLFSALDLFGSLLKHMASFSE